MLNASDKKAKSEQFMSKFARVYTPVVVFLALLLALLPLFFFHDTINQEKSQEMEFTI